ncbi:hypothetical protein Ae201684_003296 [Aphanomyces euteiches]|uniref:Core-binding (CB) domain-containing protein n=1 Tax=Aphanomyces euteiches TaxID=100861 RepID=A0A6G0XN01_9STRA|nr:hypothetical protein Ae201684_003296 [Aphanomyces euteiches]
MQSRRDFTIEEARRSRISEGTRAGYASGINQIVIWAQRNGESRLLMPSPDYADKSTLDLSIFSYWDFLDFLQWTVRNKPTITAQTLSGYRSALKSLYKDQKVELPAAYNDDMKEIFSGIKKRLAKDLQTGRIVDSGKRPLTFSMFEDLCGKSLVLQDGGFTHLFLILTWNLMCRSQSTETVRFDHISSEEDAIGFTFFKSKTKQEGETIKDPKHCYANPFKPSVCLFVALGVYLACNSQIPSENLFPGSRQKV